MVSKFCILYSTNCSTQTPNIQQNTALFWDLFALVLSFTLMLPLSLIWVWLSFFLSSSATSLSSMEIIPIIVITIMSYIWIQLLQSARRVAIICVPVEQYVLVGSVPVTHLEISLQDPVELQLVVRLLYWQRYIILFSAESSLSL